VVSQVSGCLSRPIVGARQTALSKAIGMSASLGLSRVLAKVPEGTIGPGWPAAGQPAFIGASVGI
jgi:hypothetical protein